MKTISISISQKNSVEEEKFISGERYLLSSLDLWLKKKDMTKQPEYDKIKALSDPINMARKKNYRKLV